MKAQFLTAGFVALTLVPCGAFAHAMLQTAEPEVGSTVHGAPAQVVLAYSEGVEPVFCKVTVADAAGMNMVSGRPHLGSDRRHLVADLKALMPGPYKVSWTAISVDTHKTQGTFSFTVAP